MTRDRSIGWAERTWNVATGCTRGCPWCYAREMHHRFERVWGYDFKPLFHAERLKDPYIWRKPSRVFVCSMGELFEQPRPNIEKVLQVCGENPMHRFLILTQRAEELKKYHYPDNIWLGVTVTERVDEDRIWILKNTDAKIKFVSFEPLHGPMRRSLDLGGINWVIIGGRRKVTYPNYIPKYVPPRAWVEHIIAEARRVGAAVFLKYNLEWGEVVREWPRG